jgi:endonuclease/exonuclease/phosphatase family metal-dependent hydrolase
MKRTLLLLIACLSIGSMAFGQKNQPINVISYNIRYYNNTDGVNVWENRRENVKALLKFYDADIVGVQEAMANQFDYLKENSDYDAVGVGRDDGIRKSEFSGIYFNKNRFIKRETGNFWLSTTPDVPSQGWDAALKRVCTWVKLYDKINKKEFIFFNTHFDHVGVQARIESAKLIKEKIQQIAPKLPVVFTGDLNVTPETEAIATIKSFLTDAKEITAEPPYGPNGTFNDFDFNSPLKRKIDYIFVNQGFKVQKFAALSDSKDLHYYSDHLPVFARLFFN